MTTTAVKIPFKSSFSFFWEVDGLNKFRFTNLFFNLFKKILSEYFFIDSI